MEEKPPGELRRVKQLLIKVGFFMFLGFLTIWFGLIYGIAFFFTDR